jgi:putative Mg2+ transporter-C (MgtC) family protein
MFLEQISIFSELNIYSIILRIFLALILGGLLGLDREQKQRPAGFRTYVIVCLGATLACITNIYMCNRLGSSDPARIPAQVISGIGFLGAGTILVTRNNHIRGLTTAAGLWCAATIGIALGSGFYSGAIICSVVIIFSLRILPLVDKRFSNKNKYINAYTEYHTPTFIRSLILYCKRHNYKLHDLDITPDKEGNLYYATFSVQINDSSIRQTVIEELMSLSELVIFEEIE